MALINCPVELLKVRMQVQNKGQSSPVILPILIQYAQIFSDILAYLIVLGKPYRRMVPQACSADSVLQLSVIYQVSQATFVSMKGFIAYC